MNKNSRQTVSVPGTMQLSFNMMSNADFGYGDSNLSEEEESLAEEGVTSQAKMEKLLLDNLSSASSEEEDGAETSKRR